MNDRNGQRDLYYLGIARSLADTVVSRLIEEGLAGIVKLDAGAEDLKGAHDLDRVLHEDLCNKIEGLALPAQIFIEGTSGVARAVGEAPRFQMFFDPIDGSSNCDRWVGDPAFVMAISENLDRPTYGELCFGYVQGLRSGDYYYTLGGRAYHYSAFHRKIYECDCTKAGVESIEGAVTYLNLGYGSKYGSRAARIAQAVVGHVRDVRGFDNTAMEVCEIARNAAHLRIECRQGSEGANLLASMTILRVAGGAVRRIDGSPLEPRPVHLDERIDFIAGSNEKLVSEAVELVKTL